MKKISIKSTQLLFVFVFLFQFVNAQKSDAKLKYISPKPGSEYINPENSIAFRQGDVLDASSISKALIAVTSSLSGPVKGTVHLSTDSRTLIFKPAQEFKFGEEVHVMLHPGLKTLKGQQIEGKSFQFKIIPQDNSGLLEKFYSYLENQEPSMPNSENSHKASLNNNAIKDYPEGFPIATITEFNNPYPGYVFCSPRPWQSAPYNPYIQILDNYGTPVFYRELPRRANDFKVVANNQLAFCDFDNNNTSINKYILMDSQFNITDTLWMGNGYEVDQHDLIMLENGNHFMMAYDPQIVDMSQIVPGGDTMATVTGFIVQELDIDNNVIFQWRSWDHFEITDANNVDFTANIIDYVHGNAFDLEEDSSLLISCRHMDEIDKISLETGDVIWRFGVHAQNNMFAFLNDTLGFSHQHDIRRLSNGHITVYDNGNFHSPHFSQALEYAIDEQNFTAELVWNYVHDPVVYGRATGNNRRLPNNNSFICWGLTWPINYSEVTHDGDLAWELHWPDNVWEYRAVKLNWVTDYFETSVDTIDFGTYDDYVPWSSIIILSNNGAEDITISSSQNFNTSYSVVTALPLTIPANGTTNLTVNFFPTQQGQINDVLTLKSESMFADTLHQMIGRQVFLTGFVADNAAPEVTFDPADGDSLVSQNAIIKVSFDESIVKADGSVLKSTDIPGVLSFKETDASGEDVAYSSYIDAWKKVIVIMPDTLKPLQQYYVELHANTIADNNGNVLSIAKTSTFVTEETSGIGELTNENFARIYPNPNRGLINLEFQNQDTKQVQVFDAKGDVVFEKAKITGQRFIIDIRNYPQGMYLIKVINLESNVSNEIKTIKY